MKPTRALGSLVLLVASINTVRAADCDRECLRGIVTQYLDAMVAHKPAALPVSNKVRFTEDTVEKRLGDGLWKTASGLRKYRQDILDVRQGVAASQVVVEEAGVPQPVPVMLMLRLKVADKKITEVETQTTRSRAEGGIFTIDALQTAGKTMNLVPERAQLNSREDAIKAALFYPAGLKIGSFVEVDAPFASDAYRIENGNGHGRAGVRPRRLPEHQDSDHHEAPRHHALAWSRWMRSWESCSCA